MKLACKILWNIIEVHLQFLVLVLAVMERMVSLKTCIYIACMLVFFSNYRTCLKSDYKRVIFSKFVRNEIKRIFQKQLENLNDKDGESRAIKELYEKYLSEQKDYFLNRLQPSTTIGSKHNITLEGNRKRHLTIQTISKRRPLIFQIDDFLFDDECEHLINKAKEGGLEGSLTGGGYLEELGVITNAYDEVGSLEFDEFDLDGDSYINTTELHKLFQTIFNNKMGMVLVNDLMRKTYMDFDLDGKIAKWEWNSKNVTRLVMMLNESQSQNPASRVRYSDQNWLDHSDTGDAVLESIQDRLHKLTGLPLPMMKNSEQLQVVHYVPGGHYDCHLDSDPRYYPDDFGPCCHLVKNTESEEQEVDCSTCRFMTVLYYLEDPDLGGETAFPVVGMDPYANTLVEDNFSSSEDWCDLSVHCQMANVRVKPKKGRAVLWYNHFIHPDTNWTGPVDPNSLHGGCAVHKGSKWIANNWINTGFDKEHDILSWARSEIDRRMRRERTG